MVLPAKGDSQISGCGCFHIKKCTAHRISGEVDSSGKPGDTENRCTDRGSRGPGNGSLQGAVYTVSKDGQEIGKIETDEKGLRRLENLAGTYTVKETKAPAGYELDTQTYTVAVPGQDGSTDVKIHSRKNP